MAKRSVVGCAAILSALPFFSYAQSTTVSPTDGSTPPAMAPGSPASSYALSEFDTVNLYNGHSNIRLPITRIGGRGESGYVMTLAVQRSWEIVTIKDNEHYSYNPTTPLSHDENLWSNQSAGYGPGVLVGRTQGDGVSTTVCPPSDLPRRDDARLTRLTFISSDGSETELIDAQTNGRPIALACPLSPVSSRGTIFLARDGSGLRFVSDTPVWDAGFTDGVNVSGVLQFRNGLHYRIDSGRVSFILDKNGNKTTVQYDEYSRVVDVIDPLGRHTTISYASSATGNCDLITWAGHGGNARTTKICLDSNFPSDASAPTYGQLFTNYATAQNFPFNPTVVRSVVLPDQTQYGFEYNAYGEVSKFSLPTGAFVTYNYGPGDPSQGASGAFGTYEHPQIYRRLTARTSFLGGVQADKTTYSPQVNSISVPGDSHIDKENVITVSHLSTAGEVMSQEQHHFYGAPNDPNRYYPIPFSYAAWRESREYQVDNLNPGGVPLRVVTNVWEQRPCEADEACPGPGLPGDGPASYDSRIAQVNTALKDSTLVSSTTYAYDRFNNKTDTYEYDYGVNAPGGLLRRTHQTYRSDASLLNSGVYLVSLPFETNVFNGAGAQESHTLLQYDEWPLQPAPGLPEAGHDSSYNDNSSRGHGNITTTSKAENGTQINNFSQSTYDVAGNIVKTVDPNGNVATYDYNTDSSGQYAFPLTITTKQKQGYGSDRITRAAYDYSIGKPSWIVALNGLAKYLAYEDPLDRLTSVDEKVADARVRLSTFSYPSPTEVVQRSDGETPGDLKLESHTITDGFGRTIETRQYEGSTGYIRSTTAYDELGRVKRTANPSRINSAGQTDGRDYVTSNTYDALGRIVQVMLPDGSVNSTSYLGNRTIFTDAAGKSQESVYDALGRLVQVVEDPGSGHLGYSTAYSYDTFDNLRVVSQSGQVRTFEYDGLSRLTAAVNPESGRTTYTYDANGNQLTKVDARGLLTCYGAIVSGACSSAYDAFGRLWKKSYSDGTPAVQYTYDAGGGFSTGQLTQVTNGNSTTNYTAYDAFGKPTSSTQVIAGQSFNFRYTYNSAGSLRTEQYPSGRVVETGYDSANRPAWVQGTFAGVVTPYLGSPGDESAWVHYWPHGGIYYMVRGNHIWHAGSFNSRLQPTESYESYDNQRENMLLVSCPNWGQHLNPSNLPYYVAPICPEGTFSQQNNSNLQSYQEYLGTRGNPNLTSFSQTFTYDGANRLATATESGSWSRSFSYDPFGNMWVSNQTVIATTGASSNVYSAGTNRIANGSYDSAGNQKVVNGNTLAYDAENRQISATEPPAFGGGSEQYLYDGEGRRVMKTGPSGSTIYIYDALGQLSAEYSNTADSALPCQTCYLSYDHLGSVRLITDENGEVVSRHDYLPFGEEIQNGQSGRTGPFATADGIQQRFTGKERDLETGLDFSESRYYGSGLGRFTSPDPENAGAEPGNPQSWNAYSYVFNNPLVNVDPLGKDCKRIAAGPLGETRFIGDCSSPDDLAITQGDKPQVSNVSLDHDEANLLMLAGIGESLTNPHSWAQLGSDAGRATASVVWPGASAIAECTIPGGNCNKADIAAATIFHLPGTSIGRFAKNSKLRNFLNMFNRTGTGIGTGSTADAIRYELNAGTAVGGKFHFNKGVEMRQGLMNLLRSGKLDAGDKEITKQLLIDIQDALSTPKK